MCTEKIRKSTGVHIWGVGSVEFKWIIWSSEINYYVILLSGAGVSRSIGAGLSRSILMRVITKCLTIISLFQNYDVPINASGKTYIQVPCVHLKY